ncbi:hypothetical protein HDV00_000057 [Rhizophlyctis rosea]|nr:hypothetical protein HDV00_000057 [Rhizophlyctis rosea]
MSANQAAHPDATAKPVHNLVAESIDALFRSQIFHHSPPSTPIREAIAARARRNLHRRPNDEQKDPTKRPSDLGPLLERNFDLEGINPYMPIPDQIRLLKAKEKRLLIERWRSLWEQVRPPTSNWYELRGPEFSIEAKKCRDLIVRPDKTPDTTLLLFLQYAEYQHLESSVREALLDFYRQEAEDATGFRQHQGNRTRTHLTVDDLRKNLFEDGYGADDVLEFT